MELTKLRTIMAADANLIDYTLIIEEDGTGGILVHHQDEVGTTSYTVPNYNDFIQEVELSAKTECVEIADAFWGVIDSYKI